MCNVGAERFFCPEVLFRQQRQEMQRRLHIKKTTHMSDMDAAVKSEVDGLIKDILAPPTSRVEGPQLSSTFHQAPRSTTILKR